MNINRLIQLNAKFKDVVTFRRPDDDSNLGRNVAIAGGLAGGAGLGYAGASLYRGAQDRVNTTGVGSAVPSSLAQARTDIVNGHNAIKGDVSGWWNGRDGSPPIPKQPGNTVAPGADYINTTGVNASVKPVAEAGVVRGTAENSNFTKTELPEMGTGWAVNDTPAAKLSRAVPRGTLSGTASLAQQAVASNAPRQLADLSNVRQATAVRATQEADRIAATHQRLKAIVGGARAKAVGEVAKVGGQVGREAVLARTALAPLQAAGIKLVRAMSSRHARLIQLNAKFADVVEFGAGEFLKKHGTGVAVGAGATLGAVSAAGIAHTLIKQREWRKRAKDGEYMKIGDDLYIDKHGAMFPGNHPGVKKGTIHES